MCTRIVINRRSTSRSAATSEACSSDCCQSDRFAPAPHLSYHSLWHSFDRIPVAGGNPMPRGLLISGIGLLMLLTGHVRSQITNEKQPVVKGKTASEWIDILEKDQKVERRRAALIALGILGPKVPGVITGVSSGLNDSDAIVRRSAAQTLGEMGPGAKNAVDSLARTLESDKDQAVREVAAKALGRIGADAKYAVSSLANAL